jgi:4'-phosphopantetheinyl transferase
MESANVTPLPQDEIHVWLTRFDRWPDDGQLVSYEASLSTDERARQRRFAFPEHRRQFLISHAFLRLVLSQYARLDPAEWRFSTNAHGKPALVTHAPVVGLRFNLSHTRGLAVVAVAQTYEVGVDAENVERRDPGIELARRYFAADEVAQLSPLEGEARKSAFFDFWTLKEAYIKARGLGLALPLDQFCFQLTPGSPPRIAFSEHLKDAAADWQFVQWSVPPAYRIALAVHRPGVADRAVVVRECMPAAAQVGLSRA